MVEIKFILNVSYITKFFKNQDCYKEGTFNSHAMIVHYTAQDYRSSNIMFLLLIVGWMFWNAFLSLLKFRLASTCLLKVYQEEKENKNNKRTIKPDLSKGLLQPPRFFSHFLTLYFALKNRGICFPSFPHIYDKTVSTTLLGGNAIAFKWVYRVFDATHAIPEKRSFFLFFLFFLIPNLINLS